MKYLVVLILLIQSVYPINFARYNWKKKNKLGAVGAMLLAVSSIVVPAVLLFIR